MLTENKIASIETLLSAIDEWYSCESNVQINREKAEEFDSGVGDDDDYNFNTIEEFLEEIRELEVEAGYLLDDVSRARADFYREWSEPGELVITRGRPLLYIGEGKFMLEGNLYNTDSGDSEVDLDTILELVRALK